MLCVSIIFVNVSCAWFSEICDIGTGGTIGTTVSVTVTVVSVLSITSATLSATNNAATAAMGVIAVGTSSITSTTSSIMNTLMTSPQLTAFLMLAQAQVVTIQSQLGGTIPDWFRSFGSSFAW